VAQAAVWGLSFGDGGTLALVAYAITAAAVVKIVKNVEAEGQVTVRNDGTGSVSISKDPLETATGADAFALAANTSQVVWLRPGEALYAVCPGGQTASVEVI
jgi:hypothetical protein